MSELPSDGWFVRDAGSPEAQLWHIAEGRAVRSFVTSPERGPGSSFTAQPGETVWDAIRRETPWLEGQAIPGPFTRLHNEPGRFFAQMARPVIGYDVTSAFLPDGDTFERFRNGAQIQLEALIATLDAIGRVVEPTGGTLPVHGHDIRNLLILAATEVEMHMRSILEANGVAAARPTTRHFVKLAEPLFLRGYGVRFLRFPDLPTITPFAGWNADVPTASLEWYDAYNGVKHSRDREFERASLGNALAAIAGCAVMLVAQFGAAGLPEGLSRFLAVESPPWSPVDMYVAPQDPSGWVCTPHDSLG